MTPTNDNQDDDREHLPDAEVHRTTVRDDVGASLSVVSELARLRDCSPSDLEPISYDVDPEKLDWIVEGAAENKVSFDTNGYAVTVYGDGTVVFAPLEA